MLLYIWLLMIINGAVKTPLPERSLMYALGQGEFPSWSSKEIIIKITLFVIIFFMISAVIFLANLLTWVQEELTNCSSTEEWICSHVLSVGYTALYTIPIFVTCYRLFHGITDNPTMMLEKFIIPALIFEIICYIILVIVSHRPFSSIISLMVSATYTWLIGIILATAISLLFAIFGVIISLIIIFVFCIIIFVDL